VVRGDAGSDSEAVRTALLEAAARRRARSSLIAEVERLAADDGDREEMPGGARAARRAGARSGRLMVRGEVFRLPARKAARGNEQRGARYAVVVQTDELMALNTTLVAPTSISARSATFRPTIEIEGTETRVLVEQTTVVDPQRLGRSAGRLEATELQAVDEALSLVLGL
jgi:mRNA interferase MazF